MAPESESKRRSDLPDKVLAYLTEHGPATPYTIGKGIARSAGAVTVAGRYLAAEGRLSLSDKPLTLRMTGDERQAAVRAPKAERGAQGAASKGKAAERIATLNAHKAAASAARDAGHPIPDSQLASMDAKQTGKVERARRTRQAPRAMASAS